MTETANSNPPLTELVGLVVYAGDAEKAGAPEDTTIRNDVRLYQLANGLMLIGRTNLNDPYAVNGVLSLVVVPPQHKGQQDLSLQFMPIGGFAAKQVKTGSRYPMMRIPHNLVVSITQPADDIVSSYVAAVSGILAAAGGALLSGNRQN